jgi:hypothetical protein
MSVSNFSLTGLPLGGYLKAKKNSWIGLAENIGAFLPKRAPRADSISS